MEHIRIRKITIKIEIETNKADYSEEFDDFEEAKEYYDSFNVLC